MKKIDNDYRFFVYNTYITLFSVLITLSFYPLFKELLFRTNQELFYTYFTDSIIKGINGSFDKIGFIVLGIYIFINLIISSIFIKDKKIFRKKEFVLILSVIITISLYTLLFIINDITTPYQIDVSSGGIDIKDLFINRDYSLIPIMFFIVSFEMILIKIFVDVKLDLRGGMFEDDRKRRV